VIDYSLNFTTANPLTVSRLVFPGGADKVFDGTTTATFAGFNTTVVSGPVPAGLTLVAGPGNTASFANTGPGVNIPITFSGFTLGGASAGFALPRGCCGEVTRTSGTITPVAVVVAPAIVAPAIVPPVILAQADEQLPLLLPVGLLPIFIPFAVLPGMDLRVEGIRMPPIELVQAPPPPPLVIPPPVAAPVYVPPALPPRRTRN